MLVFSAFTPHPPIIIPTIGREHLAKIPQTAAAMHKLEQELYAAKPEVIIIISPHGYLLPDAFTINLAEEFKADFEQFGDFTTKLSFKGNLHFFNSEDREKIQKTSPLAIITESKLDHGATIPLYQLTAHLKNFSVIPIGYNSSDYRHHLDFGIALKEVIVNSPTRVALIASGDLSHCLTPEAPGGFNPQGKVFDDKLVELLTTHDLNGLFALDQTLIEAAQECGFRSLMILLGVIKNINFQPEVLAYENPFGVGYLTAQFKL
ncbi:MAG: AmmeMemoRadiSam system protein B [Candidatus Buchananbacteria bacterium]